MKIFGIQICPSPLMVEKKVMRVRGGYLNRWLIRAEVIVPRNEFVHDRVSNRIYCHPDMVVKLKEAM